MTADDARFARRWAARRVANGLDPALAAPNAAEPVLLTAAMALLSDYEDAIYRSSRHALRPGISLRRQKPRTSLRQLDLADVRRLWVEILDSIDASSMDSEDARR